MKFTPSHEWIRVDGEIGTVGITDYAQSELGEVVYVQLPPIGKKVQAGEEIAVLESTKAAADVYSPVSGEIMAINPALLSEPQRINPSAEGEGWLFKIQLSDLKELDGLLDTCPQKAE